LAKVLVTIGQLEPGGAELRLLNLIQALKARQAPVEVTILATSGKKGRLDPRFVAAGADVVISRPSRLLSLWDAFVLCRKKQVDVLHANASLAGGFYCFVAWLAGVPARYAHIRSLGYDEAGWLRSLRSAVYRFFLNRFSTRVIGVCDAAQAFAGTPDAKWLTLYGGIEPPDRVERIQTPGPLHILMLANVRPAKNPLKAVGIVRALWNGYPDRAAQLHVVGSDDGALGDRMKALARRKDVLRHIKFHGVSNDPFGWIARSAVLLLPSVREGLPGAVLEALASGTPVVASALPGVEEIAARTSGVTMLDPAAPDEEWAEAIVNAADMADHAAIAADFKRSPFVLDEHLAVMSRLWSAGAPVCAAGATSSRLPSETI
jgi:glycosyltransferase involved in cell wall biosynthesis